MHIYSSWDIVAQRKKSSMDSTILDVHFNGQTLHWTKFGIQPFKLKAVHGFNSTLKCKIISLIKLSHVSVNGNATNNFD